jgi:RNA polymerase sigma-70 factor (ECF subfamily)
VQNRQARHHEQHDTFIHIWDRNHSAVYRACVGWLGRDRDQADEAYGRAAIQAFTNWPAPFRDDSHARAWLLTLARNVCMDLHRERRRRGELSLDDDGGLAYSIADAAPDPETMLLQRERERLLDRAIDALPPILFAVADPLLRANRTYGQIARELGIREVTARKRMEQARKCLQRLVTTHGTPPPRQRAPRTTTTPLLHVVRVGDCEVLLSIDIERPRQPERRIARLEGEIAKFPGGWRRRLELARVLAVCGRLADAIPYYRYALERSPFPLQPWLELGAIYTALGRNDEAEALYARGAREAGRESDRMHLHALADAAAGLVRCAERTLLAAIARGSDAERHLRLLGQLALQHGNAQEAVTWLERARQAGAHDPLTAILLREALRKRAEKTHEDVVSAVFPVTSTGSSPKEKKGETQS